MQRDVTVDTGKRYEDAAARAAAELVVDYTADWYKYVSDYHEVLNGWLKIASHAAENLFFSGVLSAVIAFSLMNYALLMIVARFREMTYRMRETGLIDDMDLITDESLAKPSTRSEWFWIVMTAPSAPPELGNAHVEENMFRLPALAAAE